MKKFSRISLLSIAGFMLASHSVHAGGFFPFFGEDDSATPKTSSSAEAVSLDKMPSTGLGQLGQHYKDWETKALDSEKSIGSDENKVKSILGSLRTFNADQLGKGWLAYMAVIASKQKDFSDSVKKMQKDNPQFADILVKDPRRVKEIPHVQQAFSSSLGVVSTEDKQYRWLSESYEASARGKTLPKKESVTKVNVPPAVNLVPYASTSKSKEPSVMEKTMTLAALHVMGKDEDKALSPSVEKLAKHNAVSSCLVMAQQNVDQCKAASKGATDLSFCVAKHNLGEVAKCFSWILP